MIFQGPEIVERCVSDDLVESVMSSDIFAKAEEIALAIEYSRRVESARSVENDLVLTKDFRKCEKRFAIDDALAVNFWIRLLN